MEQKTLNIIFGIVIFICIITMLILYISMRKKLSNSLTLNKIKVNEIEIDKSINVNPELLVKGTYNFDKSFSKNKSKKNRDIKGLYIKDDNDKTKIPMEFRLDDLIYVIYTKNKNQFMINSNKDKYKQPYEEEINSDTNNEEPTKEEDNEPNNEPEEPEESTSDSDDDKPEDDPKETFKNIPGYNFYYY